MDEKTLVLNADFQRRSVWPAPAKTYLIDTVLRNRPMPNIYIRTKTDLKTRRSYREVVDGQQRLRTIHDFANGKLVLTAYAKEFNGLTYEGLDDDSKAIFLTYNIGVVQLFNVSDVEVLDIFQRINAYGLSLNPQELRHGKYQGALRNAAIEAAKRWEVLWDTYRIVGIRDRVRMADDQLMAQMLGIIMDGVVDGGQPSIKRIYDRYDPVLPPDVETKLDETINFILKELPALLVTGLAGAPHFLMLFAAVAHALFGIPDGQMNGSAADRVMPAKDPSALIDLDVARANLGMIADVLQLSDEDTPSSFYSFKLASAGSTQRIKSRSVRFAFLYRALLPAGL